MTASEQRPPWQADDIAWFSENPHRTHRLRKAWVGEYGPDIESCAPAGCCIWSLVRRLDSDHAAKCAYPFRTDWTFPREWTWQAEDDFAHALYEAVTASVASGQELRAEDVEAWCHVMSMAPLEAQ